MNAVQPNMYGFSSGETPGGKDQCHKVRRAAYNAVLSGSIGHTYRYRDLWFFHAPPVGQPASGYPFA